MGNTIPHLDSPTTGVSTVPENVKLVQVKNEGRPDVKMMYPVLEFKYAVKECYVREPVYEMLVKASENLPCGYKLRIWDAWRPLALQKELYEFYRQSVIDTFSLSSLPAEKQNEVVSKYIAIPSENPLSPPAHTTGGAVDVTLTDEEGNELDMGTDFDDFSEKAQTDYFEKAEFNGSKVQENRRILYKAMTDAGFTNLPSEWWHYDYGNANWAKYSGNKVLYKGIFTQNKSESN